jgi:hypothetical protein
MWRHAESRCLFHANVSPALVKQAKAWGLLGPALYALSAILAFALPVASWALFVGIPLLYVFRRGERPAQ